MLLLHFPKHKMYMFYIQFNFIFHNESIAPPNLPQKQQKTMPNRCYKSCNDIRMHKKEHLTFLEDQRQLDNQEKKQILIKQFFFYKRLLTTLYGSYYVPHR